MKLLFIALLSSSLFSVSPWGNNLDEAKKNAKEKHELIILNFSGSDWCGPCIRLRNEIFGSNEFKQYADSNLVLLNADFPRMKKNKLSKEQTKRNEMLADKYNPTGIFPLTLVLNAEGKILKSYDGFPNIPASEFVHQINELSSAAN